VESATSAAPSVPQSRRLAWLAAASFLLAIAGYVLVFFLLSGRIDSTNDSVRALRAQAARIKHQGGVAHSLARRLGAAERQLRLYRSCVPELAREITSLRDSIDVTSVGTYAIRPSPAKRVSPFCRRALFARPGG
jgi:hypothetical protein